MKRGNATTDKCGKRITCDFLFLLFMRKKKKKNSDYDDMTKKIIKFEITVITLGNIVALLIISVS